jgi:site-specific DNA-methyltransferase (cytosine-N4-specific)
MVHGFANSDFNLIIGDAREELQNFPDEYYQTCITSPPYWGLRDYGIENQIGAENNIDDYIDSLVEVFREVKRTLRSDGTLWLNIGDSYTSGNRGWRAPDKKNAGRAMSYRPPTPQGLKPKDLIGVPWRLAFALQNDGWYLRSDIIWNKPNCQPESVKDRPTRSHEYIFLLTKSEKYYYDNVAAKEDSVLSKEKKNKRTVWNINTRPFEEAHFAVFPPELVETCLLIGTQMGSNVLDPFLGSGTVAQVCLKHGRNCVGIELNPEYAQITKKRLSRSQNQMSFVNLYY